MLLKEPNYQKAIDAINKLLDSGRIKGELAQQLRFEAAGIVAEQQVAYQLKSYFGNSKEICIYNNLSVEHAGVTAQIDHLVFSRRAFYLVESKSVAGTIWVNQHQEFQRQYGRNKVSIKSPIEQVKRQQVVLINLLKANTSKILSKILTLQKSFGSWTPKHFVAVSQKGKIQGPGRNQLKELLKYDQIASAILQHHKKTDVGFLKSLDDETFESFNLLNKKEIGRLVEFFKSVDSAQEPYDKIIELVKKPEYRADILIKDKAAVKTAKKMPPVDACANEFSCAKCGSSNLKIAYGRSYYFKCQDCDGNTPIKLFCGLCSGVMKTRKQKDNFFKTCKKCNVDELYFSNS